MGCTSRRRILQFVLVMSTCWPSNMSPSPRSLASDAQVKGEDLVRR